ncbi:MAG: linear amide C-N hydrolase [Ignavibacteria bacterium]|nr:linear amide C-N hydrolase [Ignavibacteria bacterium]
MWVGNNGYVLVGRNIDWFEDMKVNAWIFPRGIERDGLASGNSIKWTSKYGSISSTVYEKGPIEAINEKGLGAAVLYLSESDFGKRDENRPGLSLYVWTQFIVDNFATVDEAVNYLQNNDLQIIELKIVNDIPGLVHMALGDPSGDNAIIEYLNGKITIHHGKEFQIMTNDPSYDKQLAYMKNFDVFGGAKPLPGSHEPDDRFVRAAYYTAHLPLNPANNNEAIAGVRSVLKNVAQPYGTSDPKRPNVSHTFLSTIMDLTNNIYYLDFARKSGLLWIKLNDIDFSKGASVKKLDLINNPDYTGNVTEKFVPSEQLKSMISK